MVPFTSDRVLSKIHCFLSGEPRVITPSIAGGLDKTDVALDE